MTIENTLSIPKKNVPAEESFRSKKLHPVNSSHFQTMESPQLNYFNELFPNIPQSGTSNIVSRPNQTLKEQIKFLLTGELPKGYSDDPPTVKLPHLSEKSGYKEPDTVRLGSLNPKTKPI